MGLKYGKEFDIEFKRKVIEVEKSFGKPWDQFGGSIRFFSRYNRLCIQLHIDLKKEHQTKYKKSVLAGQTTISEKDIIKLINHLQERLRTLRGGK